MRKITLSEMLCSQCNVIKPIADIFSVKSGLCKKCRAANLYVINKEKIKQKSNEYYKNISSTEEGRIKIRKKGNEQMRRWRINNPDKQKILNKKKYQKVKSDPEKYKKQLEGSRKLHKERKYYDCDQRYRDKSKENLTDNYIKRTLLSNVFKYSYFDIPLELVELKRKQLILERQLLNQLN